MFLSVKLFKVHKPAEDTKNQVENEEGAEDHEADEVNPRQLEADGIVHLVEEAKKNEVEGKEEGQGEGVGWRRRGIEEKEGKWEEEKGKEEGR